MTPLLDVLGPAVPPPTTSRSRRRAFIATVILILVANVIAVIVTPQFFHRIDQSAPPVDAAALAQPLVDALNAHDFDRAQLMRDGQLSNIDPAVESFSRSRFRGAEPRSGCQYGAVTSAHSDILPIGTYLFGLQTVTRPTATVTFTVALQCSDGSSPQAVRLGLQTVHLTGAWRPWLVVPAA